MKLKELSQLYWLNAEIARDQARLETLEAKIDSVSGSHLSGMPSAPHNGDSRTEQLVAELVDLQAIIAAKQIQLIHEQARLRRYVDSIEDSVTRQIFECRFECGMTWAEVADAIGGRHTSDSVKKICYRYLQADHDETL